MRSLFVLCALCATAAAFELREVALFQTTKVSLWREGEDVHPYNAPVVRNKTALVRAYVELDEGEYAPVVELSWRLGSSVVEERVERAQTHSSRDWLRETCFELHVERALVREGATLEVRAASQRVRVRPVIETHSESGVVLVRYIPLRAGSPPRVPRSDDAYLRAYGDALRQMLPFQHFEFEVMPVFESSFFPPGTSPIDFTVILDEIELMYAAYTPQPTVIYAVAAPQSGAAFGGLARIRRGSDDAWRIHVTRMTELAEPSVFDSSTLTFVHESAHTMSLPHIDATRQLPGPPGSSSFYPHDPSSIGVWGYDADRDRLIPPTAAPIMSYLFDSRWISDWEYNRTFQTMRYAEEVYGDRLALDPVATLSQPLETLSQPCLYLYSSDARTPGCSRSSVRGTSVEVTLSNGETHQGTLLDTEREWVACACANATHFASHTLSRYTRNTSTAHPVSSSQPTPPPLESERVCHLERTRRLTAVEEVRCVVDARRYGEGTFLVQQSGLYRVDDEGERTLHAAVSPGACASSRHGAVVVSALSLTLFNVTTVNYTSGAVSSWLLDVDDGDALLVDGFNVAAYRDSSDVLYLGTGRVFSTLSSSFTVPRVYAATPSSTLFTDSSFRGTWPSGEPRLFDEATVISMDLSSSYLIYSSGNAEAQQVDIGQPPRSGSILFYENLATNDVFRAAFTAGTGYDRTLSGSIFGVSTYDSRTETYVFSDITFSQDATLVRYFALTFQGEDVSPIGGDSQTSAVFEGQVKVGAMVPSELNNLFYQGVFDGTGALRDTLQFTYSPGNATTPVTLRLTTLRAAEAPTARRSLDEMSVEREVAEWRSVTPRRRVRLLPQFAPGARLPHAGTLAVTRRERNETLWHGECVFSVTIEPSRRLRLVGERVALSDERGECVPYRGRPRSEWCDGELAQRAHRDEVLCAASELSAPYGFFVNRDSVTVVDRRQAQRTWPLRQLGVAALEPTEACALVQDTLYVWMRSSEGYVMVEFRALARPQLAHVSEPRAVGGELAMTYRAHTHSLLASTGEASLERSLVVEYFVEDRTSVLRDVLDGARLSLSAPLNVTAARITSVSVVEDGSVVVLANLPAQLAFNEFGGFPVSTLNLVALSLDGERFSVEPLVPELFAPPLETGAYAGEVPQQPCVSGDMLVFPFIYPGFSTSITLYVYVNVNVRVRDGVIDTFAFGRAIVQREPVVASQCVHLGDDTFHMELYSRETSEIVETLSITMLDRDVVSERVAARGELTPLSGAPPSPSACVLQRPFSFACNCVVLDALHVATAAHCVEEGGRFTPLFPFQVLGGADGREVLGTASRWRTHPSWRSRRSDLGSVEHADVAVVRLDAPLPSSAVPLEYARTSTPLLNLHLTTHRETSTTLQTTVQPRRQNEIELASVEEGTYPLYELEGDALRVGDSGAALVSNGTAVALVSYGTRGAGFTRLVERAYALDLASVSAFLDERENFTYVEAWPAPISQNRTQLPHAGRVVALRDGERRHVVSSRFAPHRVLEHRTLAFFDTAYGCPKLRADAVPAGYWIALFVLLALVVLGAVLGGVLGGRRRKRD